MFTTDVPIQSKADDRLKRAGFAEALGKAILDYREEDSLVIGLYGTWGSGKTSVINMAMESLHNCTSEMPTILRFSPWNYSDQEQLISEFFRELAAILPKERDAGFARVANLLDAYAAALTPLVYIPNPTTPKAIVQQKLCKWSASLLRKFVKTKNLDGLKRELNDALRKYKRKIVVVIDDIDRLNNTEIRQIFQLVKSLADFKNTIYVLAFDKEVVVRALSKVQEGDGHEYLEKVVQVPFAVPAASIYEVHRFLLSSLDSVIADLPQERWSKQYWTNVFHSGIRVLFETIRDVNRFINVFQFKYALLKDDVNPIDLTAMTAIQVFLPDLYAEIRQHKDMFVEGYQGRDYGPHRREALAEAFSSILNDTVHGYPVEEVVELLKEVFPRIGSFVGGGIFSSDHDPQWRRLGRVCADENFDIYFQLSPSSGQVLKSEMERLVAASDDYEHFRAALERVRNDEDRLSAILERLLDYGEEIPEQNIETIVSVLIAIGDSFPKGNQGWLSFDNMTRIGRVNHWLLKRIKDQEKCYKIVRKAIEGTNDSIYTVIDAVVWLGWEHGKGTENGPRPEEERKVSEAQLAELEKLVCEHIGRWASDGRLIKHDRLIGILWMWERWAGEEIIKAFLHTALTSNDGLLEFIEKIPSMVKSQSMGDYGYRTEYQVDLKSLSHFVQLDEIAPRLRAIRSGGNFDKLTQEQRRAVELVLDTYDGKRKPMF